MFRKLRLLCNHINCDYEIIYNGFSWVSDGRRPYVIIRKKAKNKYISTYRPFSSALKKSIETKKNCIICRYNSFVAFGKKLDFTLICTAKIVGENAVEFSLKAENETGYEIQAVYFPAPFNSKIKGKNSYHVDSMRQGFILPDGYKKNFLSTFGFAHYLRKINTGDCYMPLWGRVCDGNGFSAIALTPYDACMFSSFGRHASFVNSIHWMSSLGKLSYERKIRYTFHSENCDYNTIAKDFRNYLIENGKLKTIDDKIKENENIKKLIGCPVLHHKIYSTIQPESKFYDKNSTNQKLYATFERRAAQLQTLKEAGLENLYIHTDGWGELGYDNLHPYILPPCKEAGGWEGLKSLSETCRNLGYIFALHDQYRDYYYSSKYFDMDKAVMKIDKSHPYCSIWDGGEHTFLCSSQALEFVKKTYSELEDHQVDVQGAYLDVFSVMNGDECFNPNHRVTREESIKHRASCFDYLNKKGLIMSSEEPASQLIDNICLVHHGPYTLRPQENGAAVGIPVPLLSLVYHDCIMIPWDWWNNWGIPKGEKGELYCALHAGMPYLHCFGEENFKIGKDNRSADIDLLDEQSLKRELNRIRPLTQLQKKLYNKEMIRHEYLDKNMRIQRTTYSDGTIITADFEKGIWSIGSINHD